MDGGKAPVGFIGLGVMGSLLVQRLLSAGFAVVVHNRSKAREAPLLAQGALSAPTPRALAQQCSHVFTALTGPQALEDVLLGQDGLCTGARARTVGVCDLSTQDPQQLQTLGNALQAQGIVLTESPMAGSVHDASHGTLQFMQGGDVHGLQSLAPYFACWGPAPIYFGALGSANTAKLALNLLLGCMATGLAEALQLLHHTGVSQQAFMEVLGASGLRSPMYQRLWERHSAQDYTARFSLGNLCKDVLLASRHPGWGGTPPDLVRALAQRMHTLPAQERHFDYSRLLHAPAAGQEAHPYPHPRTLP